MNIPGHSTKAILPYQLTWYYLPIPVWVFCSLWAAYYIMMHKKASMTCYIILSTQYISNVLVENVNLAFSALFIFLLQYYAFLAYDGNYLVALFNSELCIDRIKVAIIIYFIPRKLGILCGPLAALINGETFSTTK